VDGMETRMEPAERMINALFDSHEKTESELRTLATSQVLMSEAMQGLTGKMAETTGKISDLTVKMAETTDKLNALIDLVHRHVTEPHPKQ
jgi:SMC interacting uncharacterized protein involved in chromosome segregation